MTITWEDADTATYSAESTIIGDHLVTVCLDNEAVYTGSYAYYWDIDNDRSRSGWARSVKRAKLDSVAFARELVEEEEAALLADIALDHPGETWTHACGRTNCTYGCGEAWIPNGKEWTK